jgi:Kef-type K+ transport system membrane component KefB
LPDIVAHSVFGEVATLLVMAAIVGFAGVLLRQPLVVSFIAVGLLAGPSVLDVVQAEDQINLLSQLGIAVLLFLVGIKLDVKLIRSLGAVSLMTGIGQVLFTSIFGFLIGLLLGFEVIESLYVSVALTFSSTIIIVKLLSDKREIDSLHGQIALGFLIVQDLVVVLAMVVLSAIGIGAAETAGANAILKTLLAGAAVLVFVVLFVRFLADPLTERLAGTPELLVTFAIGQAAMFAAVADYIGLGKELGGLLAGVSLASTPYRETISARLAPLRDFLLLFFFIGLGAKLDLSLLGTNSIAAGVFSIFVLVGNPLIVMTIMGAMGYRKRTGFLAGLTVAQISEFSLIFIAMGVTIGHVQPAALGLVTLVGLITIAASTYMITYSHQLYAICEPFLGLFERKGGQREAGESGIPRTLHFDVILFGLGRFGTSIALRLKEKGVRVLGIDFNPNAVSQWRALGLAVEYGDATDPEFIASLPLGETKWVVSTVPIHASDLHRDDPRELILQVIRATSFSGRIALTSHSELDSIALAAAGADLVLEPFQDAADRAADLLTGEATPLRAAHGDRAAAPKAAP